MSNKTKDAIFDFGNVTLKKLNRTHKVLTGAFEVLTDLNNDYYVSLNSVRVRKYSLFILFLSSVSKCFKCKVTSIGEHHTKCHLKIFVKFWKMKSSFYQICWHTQTCRHKILVRFQRLVFDSFLWILKIKLFWIISGYLYDHKLYNICFKSSKKFWRALSCASDAKAFRKVHWRI
jgi:hypothetical protein